ncbi:Uncharacterised protein [Klebsiella michiganensis]|nr:Uncharacterised protein [Klebsiella michiganensis]
MSIRPLTTITLILPLLLAACSGSQTSVERNASRAVSAIDRIHFDPNTRMLKADSINSLKPMMQQLYDQGKKDRADGLTLAQAQQARGKASATLRSCPVGRKRDSSARNTILIIPISSVKFFWTQEYLHTGTAITDVLNAHPPRETRISPLWRFLGKNREIFTCTSEHYRFS